MAENKSTETVPAAPIALDAFEEVETPRPAVTRQTRPNLFDEHVKALATKFNDETGRSPGRRVQIVEDFAARAKRDVQDAAAGLDTPRTGYSLVEKSVKDASGKDVTAKPGHVFFTFWLGRKRAYTPRGTAQQETATE